MHRHPLDRFAHHAASMLLAAVLTSASAPAQDAPTAPPPEDGPRDVTLLRLPETDTSSLEPAVAELLAEKRAGLDAALEDPPGAVELASAYGELGLFYHAHELWPAAEACYDNASRLDPGDARWPYALGRAHQAQGDLELARAWLERALQVVPRNPAGLVHLAEVYVQQNHLDAAETLLDKALEILPLSPSALAVLGEVALAQGRYDEAIEHLDLALQQVPEADRLHYPLAMAYRAKGDLDAAREHLAQHGTVGVKPPDPVQDAIDERRTGERVFLLEGRRAFQAGQFAAAAHAFARALEAAPDSVRARVNLGSALAMAGDLDAGEAELRRVLEAEPEHAGAHYNLGLVLERRGDLEPAAASYRRAVDFDPRDLAAHAQLGRVLRRLGRPADALPHLEQVAQASSADAGARLDEAAVLAELGRYAEAKERLVDARRTLPEDGPLAHALARLLAASPDPEVRDGAMALDLARRVVDAAPTAGHLETLALALAETGDCAGAAEVQARLIEGLGDEAAGAWLQRLRADLARFRAGPPCRPELADAASPP